MRQVSGRWSPKCGSLPQNAGDLVGLYHVHVTCNYMPVSAVLVPRLCKKYVIEHAYALLGMH